jgi:hypothetical protein
LWLSLSKEQVWLKLLYTPLVQAQSY